MISVGGDETGRQHYLYRRIADLPSDLQAHCHIYDNRVARIWHPFYKDNLPTVTHIPSEDLIPEKERIYNEYLEGRKFGNALFVVERPYRPTYLLKWEASGKIGDGYRNDIRYWKLVNWAWTDTEFPHDRN